jgi:hypothetical protein
MIFTDSRYANGKFFKAYDSRTGQYSTTVLRNFPYDSENYYYYVWVDKDRIDLVAQKMMGNADFWSKIMDFNPEIIDPFTIPAGTTIRIPSA